MTNTNEGVTILNGDAAKLKQKTVIVLGVARGGTSMVAGTLHKLGINMGKRLSSIYEDQELAQCINENNSKKAKAIIRERNDKYDIWGIKKLSLRKSWHRYFRDPVYIVIFRDLFASANRRTIVSNTPLIADLFSVCKQNLFLLFFLRFTKRPVLLVSYEKALLNPQSVISLFGEFLGIGYQDKMDEIVDFITPSPSSYTNRISLYGKKNNKHDNWYGNIDVVNPSIVSGWLQNGADPEPLEIELIVNNKKMTNAIANIEREDVLKHYPNLRSRCGFSIYLEDEDSIHENDEIIIRSTCYDKSLTIIYTA